MAQSTLRSSIGPLLFGLFLAQLLCGCWAEASGAEAAARAASSTGAIFGRPKGTASSADRRHPIVTVPRVQAARLMTDAAKDPIEIDLISFHNPLVMELLQRGELDREKPPILVSGRQVENLSDLRRTLRALSQPVKSPLEEINGREVHPIHKIGERLIYPSSKTARIRCDQQQVFGWVQVLLTHCTFIAGRSLTEECELSPLIAKFEFVVCLGTENEPADGVFSFVVPLDRVSRCPSEVQIEDARIIIADREAFSDSGAEEPTWDVLFLTGRSYFGAGRGRRLKPAESSAGEIAVFFDPADLPFRILSELRRIREACEDSEAEIEVDLRVPYLYVARCHSLFLQSGFPEVSINFWSQTAVQSIVRGRWR